MKREKPVTAITRNMADNMIKEINIKVIPYREQRYETYGDYWFDENKVLQVRASSEDNNGRPFDSRFIYGIILHELFELGVVQYRNISIDKIEEFDKAYLGSDPGSHPEAPYHKEHMKALAVEEMFYQEVEFDGTDPIK